MNIEEKPLENGAPAPPAKAEMIHPSETEEAQWSPHNPSAIWDNLGISDTISMGTPIFESPNRAVAYGAFKTSDAISAWAQKQRDRLIRMGWTVTAQWSDLPRHAYRIHREEEQLCAIYIPSSTESSLVIFERPGRQAIMQNCEINSSIPNVTVSDIDAQKLAAEDARRRIWQERGLTDEDQRTFVVDISPEHLRYTIPSLNENEGTQSIMEQLTQSGWTVEAEGKKEAVDWSGWIRQKTTSVYRLGPQKTGCQP